MRVATEPGLRGVIQAKLKLEWSPEQIAAWLRREFPDRPRWHLCRESLYKANYHSATDGHLRTGTLGWEVRSNWDVGHETSDV